MHEALIVYLVIGLPVSWAALAAVTLGVRLKRKAAGDYQPASASHHYGGRS